MVAAGIAEGLATDGLVEVTVMEITKLVKTHIKTQGYPEKPTRLGPGSCGEGCRKQHAYGYAIERTMERTNEVFHVFVFDRPCNVHESAWDAAMRRKMGLPGTRGDAMSEEAGHRAMTTGYMTSTPPPKTFEQALWNIYRERLAVMKERQRKYGPENVRGESTGDALLGLAYRMKDKLARFKRTAIALLADDEAEDFADESLEDTLIDMGNYSDIALMVERGWWGLPMEEGE